MRTMDFKRINLLPWSFFALFLISLIPTKVQAEDARQFLPDTLETIEGNPLEKIQGSGDKSSPYVQGLESNQSAEVQENELKEGKSSSSPFVHSGNDKSESTLKKEEEGLDQFEKEREELTSIDLGVNPPSKAPDQLLEFDQKKLLQKARTLGRNRYTLNAFYDSYDYNNSNDSFGPIFESTSKGVDGDDSPSPFRGGHLLLNYHVFLTRGLISPYWGVNTGFGLSYGRGRFQESDGSVRDDSELSEARIRLWSFPLEFTTGFTLSLGGSLQLDAAAGFGLLGLWQSRSDVTDDDERKNRRQMSPGYSLQGGIRFDLSSLLGGSSLDWLQHYHISRASLFLSARFQEYSDFKEEQVSVDGSSLGLGISFETF